MNLRAIAEALRSTLEPLQEVAGINVYDTQVALPVLPCVMVGLPAGQYDDTMGGTDTLVFPLYVIVQSIDDPSARKVLDGLLARGVGSIKSTLEDDDELGGVIDSLRVTGWENLEVTVNGHEAYAARVSVEVYA